MAPYNFDALDADVILRSSDGKELRVHRLILSLSSPVFQGMFGLPQPTDPSDPSQIPTIDVADTSDILEPFIQHLYPKSSPKVADIQTWAALYAIADKYSAEAVMELLRDILIPQFLEASPLRVYALASRWGFEEEAKAASRRTLAMDIFKDFPLEDAELMGGVACQRLLFLHLNRRQAAQDLVAKHPLPSSPPDDSSCPCTPNYNRIVPALTRRIGSTPWLTAEELIEDIPKWNYLHPCKETCRNSMKNTYQYFSTLLEGISILPQTI